MSATDYEYDARGNVEAVRIGQDETTYTHSDDILTSVTGPDGLIKNFSHDVLGRMTYDGTTDQSMTYNILDLVGKVSKGGAALANYLYFADGTKISALDGGGEGLVYRGPFVYRRSTGGGAISLTLESAAFGGGRLTPSGAMLYVTDYLGSVRAVVNGSNGAIYKASDYSPYGEQSDAESMQTASTPAWITFRDAYTGQEDQHPDFGTSYTDFGARQSSPALRRWMAPDPLSEKYYGISPYALCNNNPLRYVDPDGRASGDPVREPDIRMNRASNLMGEGIRSYNGKYTNHQGFDYYAPIGTDVLSVLDGVVYAVIEENGAYGRTLTIEHTDSQNNIIYSFYAHLDKVNVKVGESVTEGQVVAKSGISGNASNLKGQDQHLHFELRSQPDNIKGLTGKLDPNTVVDTKFISQDPEIRPQNNVGIIKIYKDGTEEYKDVIR